ncbi:hypothetical protein BB560_000252 [Smittium megazygosporum]|uniref:Uncharacterized protein n=1 Tax=Smittium megazygosporum TaxID=133381 RepID=A0A2T9ZKU4_9FUNG|nr:hypothetical protein BB560_000252 [Smittium megazygosporum]
MPLKTNNILSKIQSAKGLQLFNTRAILYNRRRVKSVITAGNSNRDNKNTSPHPISVAQAYSVSIGRALPCVECAHHPETIYDLSAQTPYFQRAVISTGRHNLRDYFCSRTFYLSRDMARHSRQSQARITYWSMLYAFIEHINSKEFLYH